MSPPAPSSLAVIYQDDALIVVDKPSGLLSVPGRGEHLQDCVSARVQAQAPDALIVHRLDMATSGLLAMARGKAAQRRLSDAFAQREVVKHYIAIVSGRPATDGGEIDLPLITDWPNRPKQKVDHEIGKPSVTRYRVLAHDPALQRSRLFLEPITGRSHQLRVHLLALGHPIVGDTLYAPPELQAASPRLLLHAESLTLPHPVNGEMLSFHSPAPF